MGRDGVGNRGRRGAGLQPWPHHHRRVRRLGHRAALRRGRPLLEGLARRLSQREGEPLFLNLNVPNVAPELVKGIRATRLGGLSYRESVRLETTNGDARGYRIARNRPGNQVQAADSDIQALKENYVSVTPLKLGMGDDAGVPELEGLLDGLMD